MSDIDLITHNILKLGADHDKYKRAFLAAKDFIDSHVADPDITDEMCVTYAAYLAAVQNIDDEL